MDDVLCYQRIVSSLTLLSPPPPLPPSHPVPPLSLFRQAKPVLHATILPAVLITGYIMAEPRPDPVAAFMPF